MSLRHIEAFRAVMLSGSMTSAAQRVHTSQPHISRLIAQLETITQFALFVRNGSRLIPTQDGMRFYQDVEKTFVGLNGLESSAASIRSFSAGRLSVAAMPRLAGGLLARIVARLKLEAPDVVVSIHSGNAATVHQWISSGFCDTGLAMLNDDIPGLRVEPVLTLDCVAVLPAGHRLAALKKLKPADFEGESFVAFSSGSSIRERVDTTFSDAGVQCQVTAEASLGSSVCALVGLGLGVGIVNPLAAHEEQLATGIEVRPFAPSIPVTAALLYPSHQTKDRLVELFAGFAREIMHRELGGSGRRARG